MKLPRCEDLNEIWSLDASEKRELFATLATDGVEGIDRYIKKRASVERSSIAKRIETVRKDIEKQSLSMKDRIKKKFGRKRRRLRDKFKKARELQEHNIGERRINSKKEQKEITIDDLIIPQDSLLDIILDMDKYGRERSKLERAWFRFKEYLTRILGSMLRALVWLLIKLRILHPKARNHDIPPYQFMLSFDAMRSSYATVNANIDTAISTSPELAEVVKRKTGGGIKGAIKRAFEKMVEPDKFKRRVEEMVARELKEQLKESRKENRKKKDEMEKILEKEQIKQQKLQEEERRKVKELDEEEKAEMEAMYDEMNKTPVDRVKEEVTKDLKDMGIIREEDGEMVITNRLLEIFSDIIFAMEVKNIPSHYASKLGGGGVNTGIFSTRRMMSSNEISRMNIMKSLLESRIYDSRSSHIRDEHIFVYEEERGSRQHVILAFDKSGSMADNHKMEAAKRAVLALYKAVKNSNPANMIDLVSFDTKVRVMDLKQVWTAEASGFTNTGEALNMAEELLGRSKTAKKSIYLITDGLPEAYTANGREYAGDFKESMEYALRCAETLKNIPTLKFTQILLEIEDEKFIQAAKEISDVLGGTIIKTNPEKLASELLVEFSKTQIV